MRFLATAIIFRILFFCFRTAATHVSREQLFAPVFDILESSLTDRTERVNPSVIDRLPG